MVLGAKKRVRLHTKDGKSFEGLLLRRRPEYVLDLVDLYEGDAERGAVRTQLDGRIHVERDNVSFYQVVS